MYMKNLSCLTKEYFSDDYCKVVVGPGAQFCTLLEVQVLGVGMSTLGAQTALYAEDRGLQVPMVWSMVVSL